MFPRGGLLYLTNACYLNCRHCGIVNNKNPLFLRDDLFDLFMKLLKEHKCYIVAVSGGEPLLHPNCFEYIKKIRKNGMLPVLGISGVYLSDEILDKIKKANVGCIQVSIDGIDELSNAMFRGKENFNKVITNIEKLKNAGIRVNVATCISKENIYLIDRLLEFLYKLNVYQIKIQFWKKYKNNHFFHELNDEDKNYVYKKVKDFVTEHKMYDWANIDIDYKIDCRKDKKLVMFPNGNIFDGEGDKFVGKIDKDMEQIEQYYE